MFGRRVNGGTLWGEKYLDVWVGVSWSWPVRMNG